MKKTSKIILLALVGIILLPTFAFAQIGPQQIPDQYGTIPINDASGIVRILRSIFNIMFAIFLVVATIFILLAAFNYLTAGGDDTKIATAKKQFIYAIVAIIIAFLATSLPRIVERFISTGGV